MPDRSSSVKKLPARVARALFERILALIKNFGTNQEFSWGRKREEPVSFGTKNVQILSVIETSLTSAV